MEQETKQELKEETQSFPKFKIFDKYDITEIKVEDPGLRSVINLEPKLVLKSQGRNVEKMGRAKVNIVERLVNKIPVSGHRGKKHKIEKGTATGKYDRNLKIVLGALEIIEKKLGKNPVEVLVKAIENASPRDETTVIEYGGARYPQAVDVSPLRRINLALRNICHGASDKTFKKKKKFSQAVAEEVLLAYEENGESFAFRKKNESEKQADSAR
ncbi:MAG: 30S ribosomal protein S7 [Nanoarchaeota archaeon]